MCFAKKKVLFGKSLTDKICTSGGYAADRTDFTFKGVIKLAYEFTNQQKSSAFVHKSGTSDVYKIAGVNGFQTNATNFHTAMSGLLHVVGKDMDAAAGMGRTISQDAEEIP